MVSVAFVPARSGSSRVKGKNIRELAGHPLIAWSIASARQSGVFDKIVVSTDSTEIAEIALSYGAEVPFLRPKELAGRKSPDIEWLVHAHTMLAGKFDYFSVVRATSPFRSPELIRKAWTILSEHEELDSVRAIRKVREHPGKMWKVDGHRIHSFLPQDSETIPWHSRQFQDLPEVFIQTSALEIARTRVITEQNSLAGKTIGHVMSEGYDAFAIDYEDDWLLAELAIERGIAKLPDQGYLYA